MKATTTKIARARPGATAPATPQKKERTGATTIGVKTMTRTDNVFRGFDGIWDISSIVNNMCGDPMKPYAILANSTHKPDIPAELFGLHFIADERVMPDVLAIVSVDRQCVALYHIPSHTLYNGTTPTKSVITLESLGAENSMTMPSAKTT